MSRDTHTSHPFRPADLDLSALSSSELDELREAIVERSRRLVDPRGVGYDPTMSEPAWFDTGDPATSWWEWGETVARAISDASTRIGLAGIAGGGVIGSGIMFGAGHSGVAWLTLVVSGVFAAAFVGVGLMAGGRAR